MNDVTSNAPASETQSTADAPTPERVIKRRRSSGTRRPSAPKAAYFVLQVLDVNGTPMQMDKKNVKLLAVERNSDVVLDLIDSGEHEHAFYLRGMMPPVR